MNELMTLKGKSIEEWEKLMLPLVQIPVTFTHTFAPGIYIRGATFPKDSVAIGHEHMFEHASVLMSGKMIIINEGIETEVSAPLVFMSVGGRKIIRVLEEVTMINIHPNPTNERDIDKLEQMFIVKSEQWQQHHKGELPWYGQQ